MADDLTLQSRLQIAEDVLFQQLQGEAVLLNLKTGVYFGLDPVGARVWQLLETHTEVADIVAAIVAEYDVPADRCADDVVALLADMVAHRLVTRVR